MTPLSSTDRAALLGIARGAILARLGLAPAPAPPEAGPLATVRGAFVTVSVRGLLRGCMGRLRADASLARTVAAMAVTAASEDPRFRPVAPDEIAELGVAISALGPLTRLEDRAAIRVGVHGLVVRRGLYRGLLLPKVAVREGWDAQAFLKHTCLKAGLPARAWEEPSTELEVFEAEEFGEDPA